ncbi:MAG: ATP-binding protein, partial [Acidimicrobiales bacterium]
GLMIIDEVGYLAFEQDAANLFFQLVSSRYERASLGLTSHLALKGARYRIRGRDIDSLPSARVTRGEDGR